MSGKLPTLGFGLGFRPPMRKDVILHRENIDFLEIVADHYLDVPSWKIDELELLADHFTIIPHAINLSLGSAEGVDTEYLRKLAKLIARLNPPWWSEHISFTKAGGVDIGQLSPLPHTCEAINTICRNLEEVRSRIEPPCILENITYTVAYPFNEMNEAEFLVAILERTDCGMLLDVTNLYINSVNNDYDPVEFLNRIPLERVVQLHFAGGHWFKGVLVDSHAFPTHPEVWPLMETLMERTAVKGIVLERDENLPPFPELLEELEQARKIGRKHGQWA